MDQDARIAFTLCEILAQLERLLWDRYFEEFTEIMYELKKDRGMEKNFPFHPTYHL